MVVSVKNDNGLNMGFSNGNEQKWIESRVMLEVKMLRFAFDTSGRINSQLKNYSHCLF